MPRWLDRRARPSACAAWKVSRESCCVEREFPSIAHRSAPSESDVNQYESVLKKIIMSRCIHAALAAATVAACVRWPHAWPPPRPPPLRHLSLVEAAEAFRIASHEDSLVTEITSVPLPPVDVFDPFLSVLGIAIVHSRHDTPALHNRHGPHNGRRARAAFRRLDRPVDHPDEPARRP